MLCGRCQDGLSLALGSNNCIQCPQFSYLALIIPFAAAGFGLVALLMVLNLTVSIGTINGLIFYASIVKISESTGIFFPNGSIPVLSQFIAWLNLDLGIETCFYPWHDSLCQGVAAVCVPSLHMVHHSHHHSPVSLLHMAVQQDWRQCSAGTCYSHLALIYKDLSHIRSCSNLDYSTL